MVVDEYSRFPFVFPFPHVSTTTVIKCLTYLFSLVGMPAYVHSDRGASFMSKGLLEFLTTKEVAASRSTSYRPAGNGQAERYNGVVWRAITMSPRICPLGIGRMYFLMCQILSVLSCVLLLMKHHERFFGFSRRSSSGASIPT